MNAPTPPRRRAGSLGTQLIANALVSVLLPVGVASGIAFFFLSYHLDIIEANFSGAREALTRDVAGADIRREAETVATQVDSFLRERIQDARIWAIDELVVSAARNGHDQHAAVGLVNLPIEQIEDRFRIQKSLGTSPEADAWLQRQVAASPHFVEVFFTDRNGFNVALTNPTSDFVQSDEDWWQNAWSRGISIGEVEFDDSAGAWSIEISVRIEDPDTGDAVGVMKTVLGIEPLQALADRTAAALPGGSRMAIATSAGLLVAETSSGHARNRIMNPDQNLRDRGEESVLAAFGAERGGFALDDVWLLGYARSGGREAYSSVVSRFSGFDWVILLQVPAAQVHEPLAILHSIDDALGEWRNLLALSMAGVALMSAILAIALAATAARRLTASLRFIGEVAVRAARGESVPSATIERPEEIARLNEQILQLSWSHQDNR